MIKLKVKEFANTKLTLRHLKDGSMFVSIKPLIDRANELIKMKIALKKKWK